MAQPNSGQGQLRNVRVKFRYWTVREWVGKTVMVARPDDVYAALWRGLAVESPPVAKANERMLAAAAKYGILDLAFEPNDEIYSLVSKTEPVPLRRFLQKDAGGFEEDDIATCLEVVSDEIQRGLVLQLILDAVGDERTTRTRLLHLVSGLPSSYWPRAFVVRDACVTNAPSVWVSKHFYL